MTCRFCGEFPRDPVNAGGTVGIVCRACFAAWDREQEARELGWLILADRPFVSRRPVQDLTGQRFGELLVLGPASFVHVDGMERAAWRVRCDCGGESVMRTGSLRRGARRCRACAYAARKWSKLTPVEAGEIRDLRARGLSYRAIAERFRVSVTTAHAIVHETAWRTAA